VLLFDFVEFAFHAGGELNVHDFGEGLDEFIGDDGAERWWRGIGG